MKLLKAFVIHRQDIVMLIIFLFSYVNSSMAVENISVKKEIIVQGKIGSAKGDLGSKMKEQSRLFPSVLAVDSNGSIYIADPVNDRIQKYDNDGEILLKIKFTVDKKRYNEILKEETGDYVRGSDVITDMTTDSANNLYVVSRPNMKIYKYSSSGKLLQSINLDDKALCWSEEKGWYNCAMQIERMFIDIAGNIYLQGVSELIKFNAKGAVDKQWAMMEPSFFLDREGFLYWLKGNSWEKYDKNGKINGVVKCERPYFQLEKGGCKYPRFIDKNGFLYFYDSSSSPTRGLIIFKSDKQGKRYGEHIVNYRDLYGNNIKFDEDGNFYILHISNNEFWVDKISWN